MKCIKQASEPKRSTALKASQFTVAMKPQVGTRKSSAWDIFCRKKKQFGSFFAFQCRTTCRTKATRQFLCKYKPYCTKPLFMTVLDCHSSSWDHVTTSSVNTYFMTYFLQFQVRYFEKVESQYSPKMKLLKSLILNLSLKIQREIDDF